MTTDRTIDYCLVYVDSQDPADEGWAYRVVFDDGHQESGPCVDLDDGIRQCAAHAPEGVVPLERRNWAYRDHEGDSFIFRAE